MKPRILLAAAVLGVVSCTDVTDPAAMRGTEAAVANTYYTAHTGVDMVNGAGTRTRHIGGAVYERRTAAGVADTASDINGIVTIDETGTAFGWTNNQQKLMYWPMGGDPIVVEYHEPGESRMYMYGRTLPTGEVIITLNVAKGGVTPANEGYRLYRWSSVSGYTLLATSSATANYQSYIPTVHGITADGSVIYSLIAADFKNYIYRVSMSGAVTHYLPPAGGISGFVGAGNTGPGQPSLVSDDAGRLVGNCYTSNNTGVKAVVWDADGTGHWLPTTYGNSGKGMQIKGDWIVGNVNTDVQTRLVRWHWNGTSWDTAEDFGAWTGMPVINSSGVVGLLKSSFPGGFAIGTPGNFELRLDDAAYGSGWVRIDESSRLWWAYGTLTPSPSVTVAATASAVAGKKLSLPVSFAHPVGAGAGPFTWSVQWNTLRNTTIESGSVNSVGSIPSLTRIYNQTGEYTIRTIVTDAAGRADTSLTTATIVAGTDAPTAVVSGDLTVPEGTDISLSASGSTDPNGLGLTYGWRFDGVNSTGATLTVTKKRGSYAYRLIATNSAGLADTAHGTVVVENVAPTGTWLRPAALSEGRTYTMKLEDVMDALADKNAGIQTAFDCGAGYGPWGSARTVSCSGALDNGMLIRGVKLRDQLGAVREYGDTITVTNNAPRLAAVRTERDGAGTKARLVFTLNDVAADAPWTATYRVNGTPKGTPKTITTAGEITGPYFGAAPGDVISVRVVDKDGKAANLSVTVTP